MTEQTEASPDIVAEMHGVKVPASPMLSEKHIARINGGRYEGPEVAGVMAAVRPGDKILEMGSGIGLVGAIAAKNGKAKKLVSFEANPNLIPHIKKLYALNGLSKVAEVRNELLIAGPNRPESLTFHVHGNFLGSGLAKGNTRRTAVTIPTASYEEVKAKLKPDVIIMDIEGAEADFLQAADLTGVRAIVVEFHPAIYTPQVMRRLKGILGAVGFKKNETVSTRQVWTAEREL